MQRLTLSAGGTSLIEFSPSRQNITILSLDSDPRTAGVSAYFQTDVTSTDTASTSTLGIMPGQIIEINSMGGFSKLAFSASAATTVQILY